MTKKQNFHIKIGDKIQIISGSQKGLLGTIKALNKKKSLVFIDSIKSRIRYVKNRQNGEAEKKEIEIPIHVSNIMLWDKDSNQASKIGYKLVNEKKERYFKKSGNIL